MPAISGATRLVALLGSPVAHSRSPALQNAAFAAAGIDAAYLAFDVGVEQAAAAVQALRTFNALGANVTMPLKRAVCAHLDELSPAARLGGAVNTIVNDGGRLVGHTTDGAGWFAALDEAGIAWAGRRLVLLGAGGAASAVAIEAALRGMAAVTLVNPRDDFWPQAGHLLARLQTEAPGCALSLLALDDHAAVRAAIAAADILANGTPVGMDPDAGRSPLPDAAWLHPGLVVADMVYEPQHTVLLAQAQARGCRTVGGLGMQRWQGALSFALWTGQAMPEAVLRGG